MQGVQHKNYGGSRGVPPSQTNFVTKIGQVISMDFRRPCNLGSQPELWECMNDLGGTKKQTSIYKETKLFE